MGRNSELNRARVGKNEGNSFPVATRIAGRLRGSEGEIGERTTYTRITVRRKEVGDRK